MNPINMKSLAVAELTLRKIKEPAFILLGVFGLVLGACVSEMDSLSFHEELFLSQLPLHASEKPIMGGFFIIMALSALIGIFAGASEIPKDIETRGILLVLGKPVSRIEYLAGKYIGIIGICVLFFAISSVSLFVSHIFKTGESYPISLMIRQLALIYAIFPFIAITVAISCFVAEISAMIFSVIYIFVCFVFCAIPILMEMLPKSIGFRSPLMALYYFFPNFYYFILPIKLTGLAHIFLIVYSLATSIIFLSIAGFRINARDLN